jgi:hypothetical protein
MSLLLILGATALARGSGGVLRQSAVDPVALVDGLDELIVYTVEPVQIVRAQMQVKRLGLKCCAPRNRRRSSRKWPAPRPATCPGRLDRKFASEVSIRKCLHP